MARRVNFGRWSARETRNNVVVAPPRHSRDRRDGGSDDAPCLLAPHLCGWQRCEKGRRTLSVGRCRTHNYRQNSAILLVYLPSPNPSPLSAARRGSGLLSRRIACRVMILKIHITCCADGGGGVQFRSRSGAEERRLMDKDREWK